MSRLFEALSEEEIKSGSLKIALRAAALPRAVPTNAIEVGVAPKELAWEMKPVQDLPASVPRVVVPSKTFSQGMIRSEVAAPVPPAEIGKENPSLQEPRIKFVSPDVAPQDGTELGSAELEPTEITNLLAEVPLKQVDAWEARSIQAKVSPDSRLVAFSDPNSLGAEKFRALVTRLDHLGKQRKLKSFQVTSSVVNEGKTLVAGNLAVTLGKYSGAKTLLIEGDLHRPSLAALFGLSELPGLSHWWSGSDPEPTHFVYKLDEMPLWILPAGKHFDRPSDILRSARFANAFARLSNQFEWIVVDSTPMLPIVDANLWSRLVDGTLLVVREGTAPVKALKKGLQALDHPKLIGVVINEVSGTDDGNYDDRYYSARKPGARRHEKPR